MGFKKGMLAKFVAKKQANINKGKGNKKERLNKPKRAIFFKTGLMDKNQRKKMKIRKGGQKENKEKNRIKRKEGFSSQAFWGNQI